MRVLKLKIGRDAATYVVLVGDFDIEHPHGRGDREPYEHPEEVPFVSRHCNLSALYFFRYFARKSVVSFRA